MASCVWMPQCSVWTPGKRIVPPHVDQIPASIVTCKSRMAHQSGSPFGSSAEKQPSCIATCTHRVIERLTTVFIASTFSISGGTSVASERQKFSSESELVMCVVDLAMYIAIHRAQMVKPELEIQERLCASVAISRRGARSVHSAVHCSIAMAGINVADRPHDGENRRGDCGKEEQPRNRVALHPRAHSRSQAAGVLSRASEALEPRRIDAHPDASAAKEFLRIIPKSMPQLLLRDRIGVFFRHSWLALGHWTRRQRLYGSAHADGQARGHRLPI